MHSTRGYRRGAYSVPVIAASVPVASVPVAAASSDTSHDCGAPGRPVDVAQCAGCWDYMDEQYATRELVTTS
jgi:hypothetical protein